MILGCLCGRLSADAYVRGVCITLAVLAAISLGVAVADIVYSIVVICAETQDVCPTASLAVLFTWIGSGVWVSIFVRLMLSIYYL